MVERIRRAVSVGVYLLAVLGAASLGACGGGGGGGGSGGGSSDLEVTPTALTFRATQGGALPAPQSVHVHQNTALVYGSSFEDSSASSWIRETSFALIDFDKPEFDHVFAVTTTNLSPGTYSTDYAIAVTEPSPYSGTGPYIPGPTVAEQKVRITYVVSAP